MAKGSISEDKSIYLEINKATPPTPKPQMTAFQVLLKMLPSIASSTVTFMEGFFSCFAVAHDNRLATATFVLLKMSVV